MSDKYLEAVATILATDNDHNLEELWIEAQQAIEDEGDAAQYDPSVLLCELYLATAKELVEAWVGDRELYENHGTTEYCWPESPTACHDGALPCLGHKTDKWVRVSMEGNEDE